MHEASFVSATGFGEMWHLVRCGMVNVRDVQSISLHGILCHHLKMFGPPHPITGPSDRSAAAGGSLFNWSVTIQQTCDVPLQELSLEQIGHPRTSC